MDRVLKAIAALDPKNDAHWTKDGKPKLSAVRTAAGDKSITQEDLDLAAKDIVRPAVEEEDDEVVAMRPARPKKRVMPEPVTNVRMVADERGYYDGAIIEPGMSFMFTGVPGKWMHEETAAEKQDREYQARRDEEEAARANRVRR